MYDIFSNFFDNSDFFDGFDILPVNYTQPKKVVCPVCKHTFEDFQKTGKFGCGACYEAFRNPVTLTLKQIHANAKHTGKVPSHCADDLKKKRRYETLKAELSQAVKNEDYEKAAKLHKDLKQLENEVK